MVLTTFVEVPDKSKVMPNAPTADVVQAEVPANFSTIPVVNSPVVDTAFTDVPKRSNIISK